MYKILGFRPKLIPTLFTIPALILLLSLSFWQFQRLQWKQGLIKDITQQSQIPAIALPEHVNIESMLYRKVTAKGNFIHDQEIHLYGGSVKFKGQNGYYILTPFHLDNDQIVIVNRGWVPEKLKDRNNRPETLINHQVEITGAIMKNEEKGIYVHDNQPEQNLWFYINLKEIGSFTKLPINNYYILEEYKENSLPIGRDVTPNIRNNHLGYALTWLFSAISLMVIYIIYHRKN